MAVRLLLGDRLLPPILFGLSFCLLACEVVLLRVLSYLQWYHFAYLVISLALLGFGASGTLLHLFRSFWQRHYYRAFVASLLLTGLTLTMIPPLLAVIPTDIFLAIWQPWRLWGLVLLCLTLFLPFFCGAFALILVFSFAPRRIALNYGANLLGSGTGALGGLLLLYRWHSLDILPLLGILTAGLGVLYAVDSWWRSLRSTAGKVFLWQPAIALTVLVLIAVIGWAVPLRPAMSPYKALSRTRLLPQMEILAEQVSPLGDLTIARSPTLRSATGLSLSYQGEIRPQAIVYNDGNSLGAVPLLDDTVATAPLRHISFALPYRICSDSAAGTRSRVLVLEAGAGSEVQQALMEGATAVTAVVRNPVVVRTLTDLAVRDPALVTVYQDSRVQVLTNEPRSYLQRSTELFDIIMMPPTGQVASATASMQAVYEDNLLTVEGITDVIGHLSPEGLLCATTWLDNPSRRPLKLFGLLAAALVSTAPEVDEPVIPGSHLVAIGSWNVMTVVLSRRPWSPADLQRVRQFAESEGFDLLYLPDSDWSTIDAAYHHLADTTLVPALVALAAADTPSQTIASPFHLTPPTDDRPFFHHFITLASLPVMRAVLGTAGVMLAEWGYILLWITLVLLLVGGVLLILLPLIVSRSRAPGIVKSMPSSLAYFGAIGCGFMLVEIVLIQKLVLVLGDPVFSASAVIAALLVFSGLGSVLSGRLAGIRRFVIPASVALIVLLLFVIFGSVNWFAYGLANLELPIRLAVVIAALAPLALAMGLFFPIGVTWLDESGAAQLVPWAWAVNGFTSVVATPVAAITALNLGFPAVGTLGGGCYLLAAIVSFRWLTSRQANQPIPPTSPNPNSHQG